MKVFKKRIKGGKINVADKIDLYSDRGAKLKSGVILEDISPLRNKAIKQIIHDTKRSAAVDLAGIEKALASGKYGGKGRQIQGRKLELDVVKNADSIKAKMAELVRVDKGDDTNIDALNGGKQLFVQVPSARMEAGAEFVASLTCSAMSCVQAMIDTFDLSMFVVPEVKAAIMGQYPQTMDMAGGNVKSILEIPQKDEGMGHSLRNIMANHLAAVTKKNAMNTAALSSIYEQAGVFEMGNALGQFQRHQLLGLAYQGLNADNLVYDVTKANGATGTIGTVINSMVERGLADKVLVADKKFDSGYVCYKATDVAKWNAYNAAGTLAANLVNCGAGRSPQHVSSTLLYYNDMIEKETGLPGCDYGKVQGTAVGFSFFSHSIYGGGGPGVFNGNHVVTRHSRGFAIPCVAAAVSLDAGVQMFTPEMTSALVGDTFGSYDTFREPLQAVAGAVK